MYEIELKIFISEFLKKSKCVLAWLWGISIALYNHYLFFSGWKDPMILSDGMVLRKQISFMTWSNSYIVWNTSQQYNYYLVFYNSKTMDYHISLRCIYVTIVVIIRRYTRYMFVITLHTRVVISFYKEILKHSLDNFEGMLHAQWCIKQGQILIYTMCVTCLYRVNPHWKLTFAISTFPLLFTSLASSSQVGASLLQCPHHGA